jgi:methyltransferase (TIGR00027 family)
MPDTPIENVSDTAFWIAHYRAVESARPDALFRDPLAARLAGDRGSKIAAAMPMSSMTGWIVAIRTAIIDDYIKRAIAEGVDTILNLGAGLDTRPYRMDLPESLVWIEADYPQIIKFKEERLSSEKPHCRLERAKIDLGNESGRQEMLARVNSTAKKLLVLTEGVIPYLSDEQVGTLADDLACLDHIYNWIAEYHSPEVAKFRERSSIRQKLQNAPFKFKPADWFGFFAKHGWRPKEIRYLAEEADRLHRPIALPLLPGLFMAIRALFASKERRAAFKKFSAYVLLEPVSVRDRKVFKTA